ncbi:MAG: type II toxin-antitoxin system prevent-host-death family antitoxin [Bacteroidetes bacterium]|nr:type II toxin-antitoxin system prevent-host-death family antitoxin [Bacteroidota bacterium]
MQVLSYSDFRTNLAKSLKAINDDREMLVISRARGKAVVVMDLDEYNSIQETLHLTETAANRQRLSEAIQEMETTR